MPVLGIQGRDDQYGTMAHMEALEERTYSPCEILAVPDCGHAPHLERTAETVAALTRFTASIGSPA